MWSRVELVTWSLLMAVGLGVALAGANGQSSGAIFASLAGYSQVLADGPAVPPGRPPRQEPPAGDAYCLTCHADQSLSTGFSDGRTLSLYVDARVLRDSAHDLLSCVTCHDDLGTHPDEESMRPDFAVYQTEAVEMCERCHQAATEGYTDSVHRKPLAEGRDGATCTECHSGDGSGHSVAVTSNAGSNLGAVKVGDTCGHCHERELSTYLETSHGKVARFGDAKTTATCTTCHNDHAVAAVEDISQPAAASRLAAVCQDCHDGAGESFARAWPGHSEGPPPGTTADIMGRLGFFLVAAVVAAGVLHVSLDLLWRRMGRDEG